VTEIAGPVSDPELDKDKFNGSLLVVEAESAAAVRAILEKDIFWTNNVMSPFFSPSFLWSCSSVEVTFPYPFFVLGLAVTHGTLVFAAP
jgi:hypothetical protein